MKRISYNRSTAGCELVMTLAQSFPIWSVVLRGERWYYINIFFWNGWFDFLECSNVYGCVIIIFFQGKIWKSFSERLIVTAVVKEFWCLKSHFPLCNHSQILPEHFIMILYTNCIQMSIGSQVYSAMHFVNEYIWHFGMCKFGIKWTPAMWSDLWWQCQSVVCCSLTVAMWILLTFIIVI